MHLQPYSATKMYGLGDQKKVQETFTNLKDSLSKVTTLTYNPAGTINLFVDASSYWIGAVLLQHLQIDKVAYASCTMSEAEKIHSLIDAADKFSMYLLAMG